MVSLSWHVRNPKTGGDSWDVSDTTVVKSILPGGENHQKFAGWLGGGGRFPSFVEDGGRREDTRTFPSLARTQRQLVLVGAKKLCTPEEYKTLWHMTVDTLQAKGVDNALYAYSPGTEPKDTTEYLKSIRAMS